MKIWTSDCYGTSPQKPLPEHLRTCDFALVGSLEINQKTLTDRVSCSNKSCICFLDLLCDGLSFLKWLFPFVHVYLKLSCHCSEFLWVPVVEAYKQPCKQVFWSTMGQDFLQQWSDLLSLAFLPVFFIWNQSRLFLIKLSTLQTLFTLMTQDGRNVFLTDRKWT